jgi:hypothetical protein
LEPSLFFKGQTTSLLASVTEKELVKDARGGMICMNPSYWQRLSERSARAATKD